MGTYQLARFARLRFILRGPSAPLSLTLPYELSPQHGRDPMGVESTVENCMEMVNLVDVRDPLCKQSTLKIVRIQGNAGKSRT
jgi:hypothetical protein